MLAEACADDQDIYVEVVGVGSVGASSCGIVGEVGRELLGHVDGHNYGVCLRISVLAEIFGLGRKEKESTEACDV